MGTIISDDLIDEVGAILQDTGHAKWNVEDLRKWLNAGQRAIVAAKPTAYVVNDSVQLAAGTKQTLPAGSALLMEVTRNMGTNGTTPGRVPSFVLREVIDRENPNWHRATAKAEVEHFVYDAEKDPLHYYVYPPQPATGRGYLELIRSENPPEVGEGEPIALDDSYANALHDYMLYRAYSVDAEYAREDGTALTYLKSFVMQVTGKETGESARKAAE